MTTALRLRPGGCRHGVLGGLCRQCEGDDSHLLGLQQLDRLKPPGRHLPELSSRYRLQWLGQLGLQPGGLDFRKRLFHFRLIPHSSKWDA